LNTLHLDGYRDTLVQQGYGTLDTVTDLTWEDLEEIGIKKLGQSVTDQLFFWSLILPYLNLSS